MTEYIYLFIATLIAFIVKGITGFGNTLVMGSLFSFIVPNRQITPVDLLMSIPTNTYMAWRGRKNISLKVVIPLSCMLIAGIIPGTFLLKLGNDWILKSIFGIIVTGMAIEIWLRKSAKPNKPNKKLLVTIGVISGLLAGMYGIGALLVAYISRTANNRNNFRADICFVFLLENLFRLVLYCVTGLITKDIIFLTLSLLPAVVAGLFIGFKIDAKIKKEETITKTVVILLAISGITLLIKNAFFH